jgi:hypothetical protein
MMHKGTYNAVQNYKSYFTKRRTYPAVSSTKLLPLLHSEVIAHAFQQFGLPHLRGFPFAVQLCTLAALILDSPSFWSLSALVFLVLLYCS